MMWDIIASITVTAISLTIATYLIDRYWKKQEASE